MNIRGWAARGSRHDLWSGHDPHQVASTQIQRNGRQRPIVVGVDGSGDNLIALDWACVRAQSGQVPLRIVHAFQWPRVFDPYGTVVGWDASPPKFAQQVVIAAAGHALELAPGLEVTTRVLMMSPVTALTREGRLAELIVLGRPRHQRWRLNRSVASRVARRNRGRVVIVDSDNELLV